MSPDERRDRQLMARAVELGASVRAVTPPNPWVGCVIEASDGRTFEGATEAAGGRHAEIVALAAAGEAARGASAHVTLEPCSHTGRTPPCTDALIAAGISRVVVGTADPDVRVAGAGIAALHQAGIVVDRAAADLAQRIEENLAPYLVHRRTGRPYVVLKLAASLDGRIAAPDGTSQWITSEAARVDAHRLRAESDAVIVGSGTVRADDPALNVRHVPAPRGDPRRIVLGTIPEGAKVLPATEHHGSIAALLDELGDQGVLQVLVEGGARVAHEFHAAGLVDRYVFYLAPLLLGGDDASGCFSGIGAATLGDAWRGRIDRVVPVGPDVRIELVPAPT